MPTSQPNATAQTSTAKPAAHNDPEPTNPLWAAFGWAAGMYALANAAGVILTILLAISGPSFSIDTPLFELVALIGDDGKHTSYKLHLIPFLATSAAFGAAAATVKAGVKRR